MADYETQYQDIVSRVGSLREKRAVLEAREQDKATERSKLENALKADGVDVTRLEEEESRLAREVETALQESSDALDSFEARLMEASGTCTEPNAAEVELG